MTHDDGLSLRKMAFDGIAYDDDWLVIWRGMPVGRILKQGGVAYGQPDWFWVVHFEQRSTGDLRGVCRDLDECKVKFKAAWATVRARLSEADVASIARHLADVDRRAR